MIFVETGLSTWCSSLDIFGPRPLAMISLLTEIKH